MFLFSYIYIYIINRWKGSFNLLQLHGNIHFYIYLIFFYKIFIEFSMRVNIKNRVYNIKSNS